LAGLALVHIILLHDTGSNNPTGLTSEIDKVTFHVYFTAKDAYGFLLLGILISLFIFYSPNYLGDAENFIPANPLVTPVHIMPEWYFLFAYAILRAIPSKLGGVIAMAAAILVLLVIPFIHTSKLRGLIFRPLGKLFY
jgi:ubiquinol-cytochrome c reductase cytochrome b subunit